MSANQPVRTVSEADFRPDWTPAEKLQFCLNFATLAPSSHNTQPWLFRVLNDTVELYADRNHALRVVDPHDRELTISCGAALHHLRTAVRFFGHAEQTTLIPDPHHPDLLATVKLGEAKPHDYHDVLLFRAMPDRRTNRGPFKPDPIPTDALSKVLQLEDTHTHSVWVHWWDLPNEKHRVVELVGLADKTQFADDAFRTELAHWLRSNLTEAGDGIPGYSQGLGVVESYVGPWVVRTFDVGDGTAAKDEKLADGSPLLVLIGTDTDTRAAWLAAGQALSRMLLVAQSYGLAASYLNQPIEVPEVRPTVAGLAGRTGFPQLLLRLGYPTTVPPLTPRRRLEDVMQRLHLPGVS